MAKPEWDQNLLTQLIRPARHDTLFLLTIAAGWSCFTTLKSQEHIDILAASCQCCLVDEGHVDIVAASRWSVKLARYKDLGCSFTDGGVGLGHHDQGETAGLQVFSLHALNASVPAGTTVCYVFAVRSIVTKPKSHLMVLSLLPTMEKHPGNPCMSTYVLASKLSGLCATWQTLSLHKREQLPLEIFLKSKNLVPRRFRVLVTLDPFKLGEYGQLSLAYHMTAAPSSSPRDETNSAP
ncbi:hypothetical protein OCU04_012172 [Sclerotinia nivalis]|uniref:Uncharacterized protein n=1 Tax=Sclerotinia nivalis TaxID=352851 RepID=A0A9X0AAL1_9HELO|nr:hypothetical protein OCU04_012172 [Sclerotinia nivalis]